MKFKLFIFLVPMFFISTLTALDINGTISYERINPLHSGSSTGLNDGNITTHSAKQIVIEVIQDDNTVLGTTTTDDNGSYGFTGLAANINVKIRAYAKMTKASVWGVNVVDTGNSDAQYAMDGSLATTGVANSIRDLTAMSSTKASPPFAILDNVYSAMQKVLSADSDAIFPDLNISWSTSNISTGSYYSDGKIVLLGDQAGDSDEYDTHVIIHEWGHYFEDKFSRSDSIGGAHGSGEHLDIRVAFGEGFGNAFAGMVTDDPIYFDTTQATGWNMSVESETKNTPGWFSEASVQRILYDFYDANDDGSDTLSLGFLPIYETFVNDQNSTEAFTSLFSFVTAFKTNNAANSSGIDNIVTDEGIVSIEDIYGTNRTNNVETAALPLYNDLTIDETLTNVCMSTTYGSSNKLNNRKYIKFTANEAKSYLIQVVHSSGSISNPNFKLYQTSPFTDLGESASSSGTSESKVFTLAAGNYLIDLYDSSNSGTSCFSIDVKGASVIGGVSSGEAKSVGMSLSTNPFLVVLLFIGMMFIPMAFMRKELGK